MPSNKVRVNGVSVGTVVVKPFSQDKGRISVGIGFKPDRIGVMHAAARELDKGQDR